MPDCDRGFLPLNGAVGATAAEVARSACAISKNGHGRHGGPFITRVRSGFGSGGTLTFAMGEQGVRMGRHSAFARSDHTATAGRAGNRKARRVVLK